MSINPSRRCLPTEDRKQQRSTAETSEHKMQRSAGRPMNAEQTSPFTNAGCRARPRIGLVAPGAQRVAQTRATTLSTATTRCSTVAVAIASTLICAAVTAVAPASASPVYRTTLLATMHTCDFQPVDHAIGRSGAVPLAEITSDHHIATARVDMTAGTPDVHYVVRVIPAPHAVLGCLAGDPSIATGTLNTDEYGMGSTTLHTLIAHGTTGIWLAVDLPAPHSQTPQEFYSSNYIATV